MLTYRYDGNRLQAVDDQVTTNQLPRPTGYNGTPTSLAGDFQEQGIRQPTEYDYDLNGSVTQARNKGITGIAYNHLNLPKLIHFGTGADSLVFRYTAAGQKVDKLVYQTGKPLQRTDYLGLSCPKIKILLLVNEATRHFSALRICTTFQSKFNKLVHEIYVQKMRRYMGFVNC